MNDLLLNVYLCENLTIEFLQLFDTSLVNMKIFPAPLHFFVEFFILEKM